MKLTIETATLKSTLSRMVAVCEKRNTIPILSHVLIIAKDRVTFKATDLDIQIGETVSAQVNQYGDTTVNAVMLNAIASKLPDSLTTLELKDDVLHIKSGKSRFKLNTLPASDFPELASDSFNATLDFSGECIKGAVKKTKWAASQDITRYYLNGVAMQKRNGNAVFVGCDGHRLSKYELPCSDDFEDVIIPYKTATLFESVVNDSDNVRLYVSATKIKLSTGAIEILSKVVDGVYADWQRVVPKGLINSITASSEEMTKAVERVQIVMSEKTKIMKLELRDSELILSGGKGDVGEAKDSIDAINNGPDTDIGVSAKYAIDALKQADKGNIKISYNDPMTALIVTYDKEPDLLVVVMPARI